MVRREFTPLIDIEAEPLLESYKEVRLKYCEIADKVYLNKRWARYNPDILTRLLKESLILQKFTEIKDVTIELSENPLEDTEAMVYVSAIKQGVEVHQEFPLTYKIIREESPMVSKERSGQYYQGIFQLIEGTENARKKAQELIQQAHSKGVFMNKFVETEKQCDYYLSDNHYLQQLAKKMQRLFGGTLNTTSTLHTFDHMTSRELHRVTVTLFCFKFERNALIQKGDDVYLVEAVQKDAKLRNIRTQEKIALDAKEVREHTVLKKQIAPICQRQPHITALHPETFQETEVIVLDGSKIPAAENIKVYVVKNALYYTS